MTFDQLWNLPTPEIQSLVEKNKQALENEGKNTIFAQMTRDVLQDLENILNFRGIKS